MGKVNNAPANSTPGEQLNTTSGQRTGLRPATAYTLTIQDLHTYHVLVGDKPVLVHNDCAADAEGFSM